MAGKSPVTASDRKPRRRCSHQSRQRRVTRPQDNRRRPRPGEDRPLHGRAGRKPRQPCHRRPLSKTQSIRQSRQTGAHRLHPQAPRHPQRDPARSKASEPPRLTAKTVARDRIKEWTPLDWLANFILAPNFRPRCRCACWGRPQTRSPVFHYGHAYLAARPR
jgi:hypothetical protein